ncbi:MAG TPA: hypothetical protein VG722_00895 [Tepidisphaeraceae bacterium]|nr:hypothetical protein [Tepidisphaeraceae bacterium]
MRGKAALASFLTLVLAGVTSASVIQFDPDGPGPAPAVNAATFDWLPGDALVALNSDWTEGTVYFQAKLGSVLDANGHVLPTPGLNAPGGYEITAVFGVDVDVFNYGPQLIVTETAVPTTSYFSIYFDTTQDANNLTGTGFRLGPTATKIYGSDIDYTVASNVDATLIGSAPEVPLDFADPSQFLGAGTDVSSGGGTVAGSTTGVNNLFFLNGGSIAGQLTNGTLMTPFTDVNPSIMFEVGPDGSTTLLPFLINAYNGDSDQIQFESDAATSFQLIPEPAMLTLLPLAALALRRRATGR